MTRTWKPGEAWTKDEGAPDGPEFSVTIPSSRKGHGPYRLHRDPVTGTILHQPPCEAWAHGNRNCRHVQEACHRAAQPDSVFALAVSELIRHNNLGFAAHAHPSLEAWFSMLHEAHNEWRTARDRIEGRAENVAAHAEWAAKSRDEQRAEVDAMFSHDLRVTP